MKNTLKLPFILLFFCSLITGSELFAQINEWTGGTGSWHNASSWSLGTVPTSDHFVFIGNGELVNVLSGQAYAKRIYIQNGGTLNVRRPATLRVETDQEFDAAISNQGLLRIKGKLYIDQLNANQQAYGIRNFGSIIEHRYGLLNITGFSLGLWGESGSTFTNQGRIYTEDNRNGFTLRPGSSFANYGYGRIYSGQANGTKIIIEADATMTNGGLLEFSDNNDIVGLYVLGDFTQYTNGSIFIDLNEDRGIEVGTTGRFVNAGKIEITGNGGGEAGVKLIGCEFINEPSGRLEIHHTPGYDNGLYMVASALFENHGVVLIEEAGNQGIYVYGGSYLLNTSVLTVKDCTFTALRSSSGELENRGGKMTLINSAARALDIAFGELTNTVCGILQTNGIVSLRESVLAHLAGQWLFMEGEFQLDSSTVRNESFIFDQATAFIPGVLNSTINEGLIVQPQNYAPQSGAVVSPVFIVHPWADEQVHPAWLNPNGSGQLLATYDQLFNEVTFINNLPSGIDRMDILVETPDCGDFNYFVDFAQASSRTVTTETNGLDSDLQAPAQETDLSLFPNPAQNQFTLDNTSSSIGISRVELFDLQGRQLAIWSVSSDQEVIHLERPRGLAPGTYLLVTERVDGQLDRRRLIFE